MKRLLIISLIAMLGFTSLAQAATATIPAKVKTLLAADGGRWGECMALLDVSVQSYLPTCPAGNWVTFSCSGVFTTKDVANRMFDLAQMAKALNRPVSVYVDDSKKHNGYCYVNRIHLR